MTKTSYVKFWFTFFNINLIEKYILSKAFYNILMKIAIYQVNTSLIFCILLLIIINRIKLINIIIVCQKINKMENYTNIKNFSQDFLM